MADDLLDEMLEEHEAERRKKSKRARTNKKEATPGDPMAVTPHLSADVEWKEDGEGRLQIRKRLQPKKGLQNYLARKLGFVRDTRIDLDDRGSFYLLLIDGERSLGSIERELRDQFELPQEKSRDAVIEFTKMLMRRGIVYLEREVKP